MIYYRLPFGEKIFTIEKNSAGKAFSAVSFNGQEVLDFEGQSKGISFSEFLSTQLDTTKNSGVLVEFMPEGEKMYVEKIDEVIDFIRKNSLAKLVISRIKLLVYSHHHSTGIDLTRTFLNLCETYPNALVYVFRKGDYCWIGAFSELLGKYSKKTGSFETMSLAGTIPVNEEWSRKEIEEQKPVTSYIERILKKFSPEVKQSETYDHISGNIKHLRTDFKAEITEYQLNELINELHPTPAVCGIPKDFCKNAIERFERYPREFYAGYIKIETDEEIYYFVNLRCAELLKNAALLHVGGGITADSDSQKEWRETELKSEAILKNLVFL